MACSVTVVVQGCSLYYVSEFCFVFGPLFCVGVMEQFLTNAKSKQTTFSRIPENWLMYINFYNL